MINNSVCFSSCMPPQIITLTEAINDFSILQITTGSGLADNCCIKWSYSLDGAIWSSWMPYESAASILFDFSGDYYIRFQLQDTLVNIQYGEEIITKYSTSLPKCYGNDTSTDGTGSSNGNDSGSGTSSGTGSITNPNQYNPYASMDYATNLYQQLSNTATSIVGLPIYYIKLSPNAGSMDITFKEYALMGVEGIKQMKMVVTDGQMPSSKPEFSEWGFDFSTDWETELSKSDFASAFGNTAQPMEGDLVYVPLMKRMWMVNGAYEEKNEGVMWQAMTFKIALIKYQEKGSVDFGDAESFVDSLVKVKYDNLFGEDENIQSGQDTVSSPEYAALPLYPVFESDAVRKFVKHSNGLKDLQAKLVSKVIHNRAMIVAETAYDWTHVIDESFIIYQHKFCSNDATVSFIITPGDNYCKGTLIKLGNVAINIDMTPTETYLTLHTSQSSVKLYPNKTYLVYAQWSKDMELCELIAIEHTYPQSINLYKLQPYHWRFNIEEQQVSASRYDDEFIVETKEDVTLYSFYGKITNIKVYVKYGIDVSELIQMYPTNQDLIINDTARRFVALEGLTLQ